MILIEGPDGAGKTTLTRELCREFQLGEMHSPGPKGARERTYDAIGEAVKGNCPVRIHDRLYYSELVYGSVLRQHVGFTHHERVYVETILHGALNVPTIFCLPPLETVYYNVEITQDTQKAGNDPVFPHLREIYDKYDELARNLSWTPSIRVMRYNYLDSKVSRGVISDTIRSYLTRRKERTW